MDQAPDWLSEEERLEQLARARVLAGGESTDLQRNCRLRAAFDWAAVLMVIIFLGLLCWNWNARTPAADRPDRIEYKNAFYRALDEGQTGRPISVLRRTDYPLGLATGAMRSKSQLDPLLLPASGGSLQTWLEGKDAGKLRFENNLQVISLSPPEPGRKKKKVWIPVRDLMRETPRGID